jgi:hypothetical protein
MSAANQPEPFDEEFEIDLSGASEATPPKEQRSAERQEPDSSLIGKILFRDKEARVRIDDLSINGAGVTLESRLPLNEECTLFIQLAVCGSEYELTMKCRVRHCDAATSRTYQAGLQFTQMPESTRDILKLLIR